MDIWKWRAIAARQLDDIDPDDRLVQWLDQRAPKPYQPVLETRRKQTVGEHTPLTMAMREHPDGERLAWEVRWVLPGNDDWQVDAIVRRIAGVLVMSELTVRIAAGRSTVRHQNAGLARQMHLFATPSERLWTKLTPGPVEQGGASKWRVSSEPVRPIDNVLLGRISIQPVLANVERLIAEQAHWHDLWAEKHDRPDLDGSDLRSVVVQSEQQRPRAGGQRPARGDEFYHLVATTVLDLQARGERAIAATLRLNMVERGYAKKGADRTAEGWIAEARNRGFLARHEGNPGATRYAPGSRFTVE